MDHFLYVYYNYHGDKITCKSIYCLQNGSRKTDVQYLLQYHYKMYKQITDQIITINLYKYLSCRAWTIIYEDGGCLVSI